jgi:hypothetical protein
MIYGSPLLGQGTSGKNKVKCEQEPRERGEVLRHPADREATVMTSHSTAITLQRTITLSHNEMSPRISNGDSSDGEMNEVLDKLVDERRVEASIQVGMSFQSIVEHEPM